MKKFFLASVAVAGLACISAADVRASDVRLTPAQLDSVTAAGGQIASIGPAKAKAARSVLPKRGPKRAGGQIASI
ncbi:MAG: hypothetical protein NZ555_07785 [Geminicoccaceae bacterium]|nr:hypothetical protein [Geminicoccaceae bacterium]MDW8370295.1 hypothetical protein [Geminicoccaceae bacterium]